MEEKISFRKLELSDMELLHKWLNTDFVKDFYGKGSTLDEVEKKYSKYVKKEAPTDAYIIQIDNNDVGYIQTYLICDYPDYNKYIETDEHSAGLDLYIGEKDYFHKGYGKHIIKKFLEEIIFSNSEINDCILGPEPSNIVAIKTYSNVGFKYIKTVQVSDEEEPEYIMKITREDMKL